MTAHCSSTHKMVQDLVHYSDLKTLKLNITTMTSIYYKQIY